MTRVVHLFGNWKWTGPADPALTLVGHLGGDAELLLGACPYPDLTHQVAERARERGLTHRILPGLRKHTHPLRTRRAAAQVVEALRAHPPDVLHVHFDADHEAACRAREFLPGRPAVVRSVHEAVTPGRHRRRLLLGADLLIAPSARLAAWLEAELGMPAGSVAILEVGVDLERFACTEERRRRGRQTLGLEDDEFAVGIVARIQRHRRYELLLDAWERMRDDATAPRLVILGRGTHEEELVRGPVRERNLGRRVLLPGYQAGEDYLDGLAACDAGILLVPGSDVSCRAVREWMAAGRGVLATRRDPLPELVTDGVDGVLVDEEPERIVQAFTGPEVRQRWREAGDRARATAERRFSMTRMVAGARSLYETATLARPGACEPWGLPRGCVAVAGAGRLQEVLEGSHGEALLLLQPGRSRDVVLDTLALLRGSGARRLLLEAHSEWDAPFLDELERRQIEVRLLPLRSPITPRARWLQGRVATMQAAPAG